MQHYALDGQQNFYVNDSKIFELHKHEFQAKVPLQTYCDENVCRVVSNRSILRFIEIVNQTLKFKSKNKTLN